MNIYTGSIFFQIFTRFHIRIHKPFCGIDIAIVYTWVINLKIKFWWKTANKTNKNETFTLYEVFFSMRLNYSTWREYDKSCLSAFDKRATHATIHRNTHTHTYFMENTDFYVLLTDVDTLYRQRLCVVYFTALHCGWLWYAKAKALLDSICIWIPIFINGLATRLVSIILNTIEPAERQRAKSMFVEPSEPSNSVCQDKYTLDDMHLEFVQT